MTRAWAGVLLSVLLLLGACTTETGDQPAPGDPTGSVVNDPSPSSVSPGPGGSPDEEGTAATSEPADRPSGADAFKLDEVATFDDGLVVEVAGTVATQAKKAHRGAEATGGEIVVVSVRIENGTEEEFFADDVRVTADYSSGTPAPMVTDPTGELRSGFSGAIAVGDESVATIGFAIPFSELRTVTITVDCADDVHNPVIFSGTVRRE